MGGNLNGIRGVVRSWSSDDGWGVIDASVMPGGCWAHFSVVDMPGYRELHAGQAVIVDAETPGQDGYNYRARRLSLDRS